jgi:hypothetical protein
MEIDASYQVSVHLAEGFQRRRLKCEKLTDDRRWMPSDGKSSHCLWQGELKNKKYHTALTITLSMRFVNEEWSILIKFIKYNFFIDVLR